MARDRHANGGQGSKWIRREKRLAIYMRDGLACCYCGAGIEDDTKLTLDHLTAHSHGGSNGETNLVTACHRCNSSRGNRDWKEFAGAVASYLDHGVTADEIISHIIATVARPIDVGAAKELISRRGSFTLALAR